MMLDVALPIGIQSEARAGLTVVDYLRTVLSNAISRPSIVDEAPCLYSLALRRTRRFGSCKNLDGQGHDRQWV